MIPADQAATAAVGRHGEPSDAGRTAAGRFRAGVAGR